MEELIEYVIGELDESRKFWCWATFTDKNKALVYWDMVLKRRKEIHVQMVEKVIAHNIIMEVFPA
jgi:hypothetical protein